MYVLTQQSMYITNYENITVSFGFAEYIEQQMQHI